MTDHKGYVSAIVKHTGNFDDDGIVIALYGPRGGTVCVAELNIGEAMSLCDQLNVALDKFQLS